MLWVSNKSLYHAPLNHASGIYLKKEIEYRAYPVIKFQKHGYCKKEKKHPARDQVDVRAPQQRTSTNSELKDFHDQVKTLNWQLAKN